MDDGLEVLVRFADFAKADLLGFPFDEGLGQVVAAGIAAGAAVGVGEHLGDVIDPVIFLNVEEFLREGEGDPEHEAEPP